MAENCTQFLTLPYGNMPLKSLLELLSAAFATILLFACVYSGVPSAIINCWFVA